jgi:endonuclease YncB( thermonuclease family)
MKSISTRAVFAMFCLLICGRAFAYTVAGEVVRIADGDSITVRESGNREADIRLAGIDAPEHDQAYGDQATANLTRLVSGRTVTLDCDSQDDPYGRSVCKVLLPSGDDVDLDQIKAGLAWQYKQYGFSQSEEAAREAHLGLWADPNPVQPQDFRHATRSKLCFDPSDHRIMCEYNGPVRGNRSKHIYHWPGCPDYEKIADYNRVPFPNRQAAEAEGYRAARNCP